MENWEQEEKRGYFAELRRFIDSPWVPPETLTMGALEAFAKQPRIWLAAVIKAMTGLPGNCDEPPSLGLGSWRL
jgi:hypothetical protein